MIPQRPRNCIFATQLLLYFFLIEMSPKKSSNSINLAKITTSIYLTHCWTVGTSEVRKLALYVFEIFRILEV